MGQNQAVTTCRKLHACRKPTGNLTQHLLQETQPVHVSLLRLDSTATPALAPCALASVVNASTIDLLPEAPLALGGMAILAVPSFLVTPASVVVVDLPLLTEVTCTYTFAPATGSPWRFSVSVTNTGPLTGARLGASATRMSTSCRRSAAAAVDAAMETSPDVAAMTRAAAVLLVVAAGLQAHHLHTSGAVWWGRCNNIDNSWRCMRRGTTGKRASSCVWLCCRSACKMAAAGKCCATVVLQGQLRADTYCTG